MKFKSIITIFFIAITSSVLAQENSTPATYFTSSTVTFVPSIASKIANGTFIEGKNIRKEFNPKRAGANKSVPGKGLPKGIDPLVEIQTYALKTQTKDPLQGWNGLSGGNSTPTDPTGAVGQNHFINAWNSSFRIWDKEGNALTSNASLATIFPGQDLGDPIVFYDQFADRFIITQFRSGPSGYLVAVCQGSDPVNDGWYTYQFNTNSFPDYPKFSIWSDGYYITANKDSGSAGTSEVVFAIEKDAMLAGNDAQMVGFPLPGISTSGFYSPLGFNANGSTPPPVGNAPIVYMQDDVWSGVAVDHLKIWNINVDWSNVSSSTISAPQTINTTPFDGLFDGGSFSNIPQPGGPDIDCLQATIMYMAQYRRFGSHNSVVLNFAVDLDGGDDHAGIRWYELRQANDGDDWEIYQEGTYSQPDGHSAFSGAIAIDVDGNIGLGYTVASASQAPCLRYTGRYVSDPINTMTIEEGVFINSSVSDPSTRYGDYSQMTIDPVDDKTFWYIGEYFSVNSTRNNWIGAFKIASDLANDIGVLSIDSPSDGLLGSSETVTITIRNYGIDAQSNFDVSYSVDGGTLITETFTGTINSNETAQYTFSETADLSSEGATYTIFATTSLGTDENEVNDPITLDVSDLFVNDIGAVSITSPEAVSSSNPNQQISVSIQNFGGGAQTNFDISYIIDGGAPVTESVTQTLNPLQTINYTFDTEADLSTLGTYTIESYTSLNDDSDESNNATSTEVSIEICQPEISCVAGDGFYNITLESINNNSDCQESGYEDFTNISTDLYLGQTHTFSATTHYGDQYIKVWIDFNDNFLFENSEVVINDFILGESFNGGEFTGSTNLDIPSNANIGQHLMRAKSNWQNSVPSDPCEETTYGETEDYSVNIVDNTSVNENSINNEDLTIDMIADNIFNFSLESLTYNEVLIFTVHNTLGQTIVRNRVYKTGNKYEYLLDMTHATTGVYLVRLGNQQGGKIKRIVIK